MPFRALHKNDKTMSMCSSATLFRRRINRNAVPQNHEVGISRSLDNGRDKNSNAHKMYCTIFHGLNLLFCGVAIVVTKSLIPGL